MAEKAFYRTAGKTPFHSVEYRKYLFPRYLEKNLQTSPPNFHCCDFQKNWIFSVLLLLSSETIQFVTYRWVLKSSTVL